MSDYFKFWLAQHVISFGVSLLVIAACVVFALWSLRGQKFYKESKEEKAARKQREFYKL